MSHWVEFRQLPVTFIRMHTHTRNTQTEQMFGKGNDMLVTIPLSSFMSEITFGDVWDGGKEGTLERQANQTIGEQFGMEIQTTMELVPAVLKELLYELEYRMFSDGWCPSKLAESSNEWIWEDASDYMQHNGCGHCIGWVEREDDDYLDRVSGDQIEDERRTPSEDGQGYWVGPFQIHQCEDCRSMAKTAINARKLWKEMLNTESWKYV